MKNRHSIELIKKKSERAVSQIVVLTGARQTGKSTMVKKAFPDFDYISVDDPLLRQEYLSMRADQISRQHTNAVFDEVQKAPDLFDSIKAIVDSSDDNRYILLGSSQILLMQKIKETLAGRAHIMELFPLLIPEILTNTWGDEVRKSNMLQFFEDTSDIDVMRANPLLDADYPDRKWAFDQYLKFGGMPRLYKGRLTTDEKYEWLLDYVKTFLERDLRDLTDLRELSGFIKAQKYLAINTGGLLNVNSLSGAAQISVSSARRYLSYLEMSYQVIQLQAWSRNEGKRLSKSPKVHFLDPGIQRSILNRRGDLTGSEYESAIIAEIYKQIKTWNVPCDMYHLRTNDRREVDLLLEFEDGYIPIEIKSTENVRPTDGRHLRGLDKILDKEIKRNIIISNDTSLMYYDGDIFTVPAFWFLS